MTPEEQYDAAMKALDVKAGDLVFVEKKVENGYGGWENEWSNGDKEEEKYHMSNYIGQVCRVTGNDDDRYGVIIERKYGEVFPFYFPPYCMRKATPQEIAEYN